MPAKAGRPAFGEVDPADERVIATQLGRTPRGPCRVAVRCPHGLPMVVETASSLADGTPFPTRFWLTCPAVRRAAARVESAAGWARQRSGRYANCLHREVAALLAGAHERPTPLARGVVDSWVCPGRGVCAPPPGSGAGVAGVATDAAGVATDAAGD